MLSSSSQLPVDRVVNGWQKIDNFRELQRGDIIAWEKPSQSQTQHKGSGHVMIVAPMHQINQFT